MGFWNYIGRAFGRSVFSDSAGAQIATPPTPPSKEVGPDASLQIGAQYACVKLISSVIASLPLMVYEHREGVRRPVDRSNRYWQILHNEPNAYMTSVDFWNCMIPQFLLRGNAYAQIRRDADTGELIGLYPLYSDQMTPVIDDEGRLTYQYRKGGKQILLMPEDVFHIKDMGTGIVGLSKAEFMNDSLAESRAAQQFAKANAEQFGKASGILTVDNVLNRKLGQDKMIAESLNTFKRGGQGKLIVLEANMKYQQLAMTPEQLQLLETRKFTIEEICRWNGVPPILIGAPGASTWGTGIAEIMSGFYKLTLAPMLKNFEQAMMTRILSLEDQGKYTIEFNLDALLRGDIKTRYEAYSIAVRNGIKTRNEIRRLENEEPLPDADALTAEANLCPLAMMGKVLVKEQGKKDD